ncbi:recombinase family protein [Rhizobium halophilum]|uniref:recombinase family protein n=1 Tax=Rhizobium halophilum TaxID=2846852 RepID=UPI001EFE0291|nr:recombinase family protein [Rhizobium halophilum]MCF6367241.1 recombinase family protein [Rhizobium halophilum]
MCKRVVIYARYSTDQQNPASIETQIDLGTSFVLERGWTLYQTFVDAGVSGASFDTRPGLQAALKGAREGAFDVLLCLTLDRLSRDLEHSAKVLKLLHFHEIELWTVHGSSQVSSMELGLRAVLNSEMLEQVRYRTREGMKTVAKKGRVPGGICYGYAIKKVLGADGEPIRGLRDINPDEADVIVWIFQQYAKGSSPDLIADRLNKKGVVGPRGQAWRGTAIRGHRRRGTGILNNELYIGRLVFNRLAYRKNPVSERRVSRLNSPEQHIVQEIPQLRIVSDTLWKRVKRRQASGKGADARRLAGKSNQSPKPKAGGARSDAAYDHLQAL